ncbi:TetR/AcrR family transcriptional regulator [Dactylosporangium fulvum]|uniref:TetR/AcrR family transcriptional regulator n=1 Tax=Dactylosporangium fulvum TaxID=53359 RepID=A0ABY5WAF8_9ACTN|nr:TetR/AcrR family transcriptional regulator [Dactylosporangium fulvum]UWP86532.1 TetR/AcrR family transcriptional regulator [Dactylosporangium fulvum]
MAESVAAPTRRRRPRADAQRSVEQILRAAELLVARDGPSVALEEIAREAGVGPATLYRHFPSRMHLFERVYRDRTARVAEHALALTGVEEPTEALLQWLREFVALGIEARGVLSTLMSQGLRETDPTANAEWGHALVVKAAGRLLERAQAAGSVRRDINAEDLVTLVSGVIVALESRANVDAAHHHASAERTLRVIIDGLIKR